MIATTIGTWCWRKTQKLRRALRLTIGKPTLALWKCDGRTKCGVIKRARSIAFAASWFAAPAAEELIIDSGFRRIFFERQKQRRFA